MLLKSFYDIYKSAMQMLDSGAGKKSILTYLAAEAEKVVGNGSAVSILLVDADGLLRNGASPALPLDYLLAIDGIKPDPHVGTCAAAAATGTIVMTPDFRADDKWAELRHLPLSIGFSGAWSMPIKTREGNVLGTFGTYFREIRQPSADEIKGIELLAAAASVVLIASSN